MIEEEAFLIRHSGEIPEVTLYSSIYYLQEDPEGPGLGLTPEELRVLKHAVVKRYKEIILRDLIPENRKKRIYRGIKRSAVNYKRLLAFSSREGLDIDEIRQEAATALLRFLEREVQDCLEKGEKTSINCAYDELLSFSRDLGLDEDELPKDIKRILS